VLEAAETAGLKVPKELLNRLTAGLRGQPRRSEVGIDALMFLTLLIPTNVSVPT
jgi:hypothetical protein